MTQDNNTAQRGDALRRRLRRYFAAFWRPAPPRQPVVVVVCSGCGRAEAVHRGPLKDFDAKAIASDDHWDSFRCSVCKEGRSA